MALQKLTYSMAGGRINGYLGNKHIHIVVRPAQVGNGPAAGHYIIHPPVNDPIFGMIANMTPQSAVSITKVVDKTSPLFKIKSPSYGVEKANMVKGWWPFDPPNMLKIKLPSYGADQANMVKGGLPSYGLDPAYVGKGEGSSYGLNPAYMVKGWSPSYGGDGSFVLSSRPIAGKNTLVISLGYADLMDALRAAGGASVTVS